MRCPICSQQTTRKILPIFDRGVSFEGTFVKLAPLEIKLLDALRRAYPDVLPREEVDRICVTNFYAKSMLSGLRRKLREAGVAWQIRTICGEGLMLWRIPT